MSETRNLVDFIDVKSISNICVCVDLGIELKFNDRRYAVHLNPSGIEEMNSITQVDEGLLVGAGVPLSILEDKLKCLVKEEKETFKTRNFQALLEMLRWFGSRQIKNVAVSCD